MFFRKNKNNLDYSLQRALTEVLSNNPIIHRMVRDIHLDGFTVAYHLEHDRDSFFKLVNAIAQRNGLEGTPRLGSIADAMLLHERKVEALRASKTKAS